MEFRKVTPDSIQYLKTVSLTEQARLYIKLTKLHRIAVQNTWFNQKCKHCNVIPNYINIKTNTHSRASNIAIKKAQQVWLNEESRHWFTVRDNLKLHLKVLYSELSFKLHNIEFDLLDQKARDLASLEVHTKYLRQKKKLDYLVNNSSPSSENNNTDLVSDTVNHVFYPRVKNLSDAVFSNNEIKLLEKGLKFNLPTNINDKTLQTLAVDAELAVVLNKKDDIVKNIVANQIKNVSIPRIIVPEMSILRSLKNTINVNNVVISKADKGNAIVVLNRNEYLNKVNNIISGNEFTQLSSDPTKRFNAKVRLAINKSTYSFPKTTSKQKVLVMNTHAPSLYGLPKIHKDNIPIRPVVSYIGAPAYNLAKELNKIIILKSAFKPKFSLKNSLHLVNKIKDIILPPQCKLVSLDVDSLFTNVPVNESLNILTRLLEIKRLHPGELAELIEFTQICMEQNYFKFNDKFYHQKEGLAMGSPLSPLMAEIFMDNFETTHIISNNKILYYYRYVDDIIICWTGTLRQLDVFIKNLNKIHLKIKFKLELEDKNSLNFLDLSITRSGNKHLFGIYRKPTYTDTTIPASSCHPWQHKLAAFHNYCHRLLSIPLTKENYLKELFIIYHMARTNGYNPNIIDNIIRKQQLARIKSHLYPLPSDKINKYKASLTYYGPLTDNIARTLKSHNVHVAFRTSNTLRSICNGKDKLANKQKSGVYKIQCPDCNATYVGQTGRSFETRFKEHLSACNNNQPQKSHFAKHILDSGHNLGRDHSFEVVHICNKGFRLCLLEQLEIIKHNKGDSVLLNEQINVSKSPLLNIFKPSGSTSRVGGSDVVA